MANPGKFIENLPMQTDPGLRSTFCFRLFQAIWLFSLLQGSTRALGQFNYTNNGEVIVIKKYVGSDYIVNIPEIIDGLPVRVILPGAFQSDAWVQSVTIPDSVRSIGGSSFSDCSSLWNVIIGHGVESIGFDAFSGCGSIRNLAIGEGVVRIWDRAFFGCTSLDGVRIPKRVGYIGSSAFAACRSLTDIIIPDSVTGLGPGVFSGCTGLTNLIIGEGIGEIGFNTFAACARLTNLTIPDKVGIIGGGAFSGCGGLISISLGSGLTNLVLNDTFSGCVSLKTITVNPANKVYGSMDGVLLNLNEKTVLKVPQARSGHYIVPNGIKNVGDWAFYQAPNLTSVTIPDGVVSIGFGAFINCSGLTNIVLPNGLSMIGPSAFAFCSELTHIEIPNSVTVLGDEAFMGCSKLVSVRLSQGISSIGERLFRGCTNLQVIIIPQKVSTLGFGAFLECSSLRAVYFEGVKPKFGARPGVGGIQTSIFYGARQTVVYHLPGASGWDGSTFAFQKLLPWHPQLFLDSTDVGVQGDGFQLSIYWALGRTIVLESLTNIEDPHWIPVSTNTLTTGVSTIRDLQRTRDALRLYRVRSL